MPNGAILIPNIPYYQANQIHQAVYTFSCRMISVGPSPHAASSGCAKPVEVIVIPLLPPTPPFFLKVTVSSACRYGHKLNAFSLT